MRAVEFITESRSYIALSVAKKVADKNVVQISTQKSRKKVQKQA